MTSWLKYAVLDAIDRALHAASIAFAVDEPVAATATSATMSAATVSSRRKRRRARGRARDRSTPPFVGSEG